MSVVTERLQLRNQDAFQELVEPYRYQLQVHCYRMLGSYHEAEDLVQETFLRAWRAREQFEGRSSLRNWLYRIATNACLNAIASNTRSRRILPEEYGPPRGPEDLPIGQRPTEIAWLEPYPDAALPSLADNAPGPEARYELLESVQLAFIAAIQHLPPRQRAVLLLRDVLGWSANEAAELLESSVASVNSALQRARASIDAGPPPVPPADDATQRTLVDRFVTAWEASDIEGLVTLLREDAVLSMPPWEHWYRGRDTIGVFLHWGMRASRRFRLVATRANGQLAFGQYIWYAEHPDEAFQAHALITLALEADSISTLTVFLDKRLVADFGLPPTLPV